MLCSICGRVKSGWAGGNKVAVPVNIIVNCCGALCCCHAIDLL
ncbi:DUF320 domain-containing protein [Leucobacter sp. OH1287]|nr:DUF320 domain-containing protein [Leucobacter sp. OH1287]